MSTNLVINDNKYLILTEDIDPAKKLITTKVYLGGQIVLSNPLTAEIFRKEPTPRKISPNSLPGSIK